MLTFSPVTKDGANTAFDSRSVRLRSEFAWISVASGVLQSAPGTWWPGSANVLEEVLSL